MRRSIAITGGIVAGITALTIATPAIAQSAFSSHVPTVNTRMIGPGGPAGASGPATTGLGRGNGMGQGADQSRMGDRMNNSMGDGVCNGTGMAWGDDTAAPSTLKTTQEQSLAAMAQDEQLAHDLYVALAAKYPDTVQFERIARAESMHLTAVRTVLTRYGITDPTAEKAPGTFASTSTQALYDSLLSGATTSAGALAAGVTVEKTDIAALTAAMEGVTAPDVLATYAHLRDASEHHLVAFGG